MKKRIIIFLAIFLAFSAFYVFGLETQETPVMTLYLMFPVGAALIALYTSRIYGFKSANGRAILLIAVGLTCWAVGEIIWYISYNFNVGSDTVPSPADVFYLLSYPFLGAGIYQGFVAAGVNLKTVKKSLLAIVLSVSLVLTILVAYFMVYQAYDPTADVSTNILNLTYGLVDLVLVIGSLFTILVANEYKGGKLALFWKIITAGFFLYLISDILNAMYQVQYMDSIKPYVYIDLLYTASYIILAFGMLENYLHVRTVQKNIKFKLQQRQ